MTDLPTHRKGVPLADLDNGHLHNAYRKDRDQFGPDEQVVKALRAEIERRGHDPDDDPRRAPASDRSTTSADNAGPDAERAAYKATLEEENRALLQDLMRLELDASKLPRAVESEADVARIDEWVKRAAALKTRADKLFDVAKAPWRIRGQVVDEFFREIKRGIDSRVDGVQDRKKPYLIAKRQREEAERQAALQAQQRAAAEQRAREQAERDAAAAAQREADEAAARLAQAESLRADAEAAAEAGDPTILPEELVDAVDEAEEALRAAQSKVFESVDAAAEAASAAQAAEDRADGLSADSHVLPKVGASQLKSVWRPRIVRIGAFIESVGPLYRFFRDADVTAALERAAKADPRPTIPGVEWFEDFDVKTDTRARR